MEKMSIKPKLKNLTVVVLTRNAEETLQKALESSNFSQELIVVDDESTDKTVDIALKYKAKIITLKGNFAHKRTKVLEYVKTDWVLYQDSDEEIDPTLQLSIRHVLEEEKVGVYSIARHNFFLGKRMYDDQVERLFAKSVLKGWKGRVHESPITTTKNTIPLEGHVNHFTHRNISDMLAKTNEWSEVEAQLRFATQHPPVAWWRVLRIGLTEAWNQLFKKRVWRFGREGIFEGYFQVIDKMIIYTKLWTLQQAKVHRKKDISH